jgi:hypothetical protein
LPGAGKTGDTNWTKAQIVEHAIKFVRANRSFIIIFFQKAIINETETIQKFLIYDWQIQ